MNYFVQAVDPRIRVARILAILSLLYGLVEIGVRGLEAAVSQPLWGNQVYVKAVQVMAAIAIIAAAIRVMIKTERVWPLIVTMMIEIPVQVVGVASQLQELYERIARYGSSGIYSTMVLTIVYHINYAVFPLAVIFLLWGQRGPRAVANVQSLAEFGASAPATGPSDRIPPSR